MRLPLALSLLEQAAGYLVGIHDFVSFGTPPRPQGTTVREVKNAEWQSDGDEFTFEIIANAFLYRMVRRLVSYQVSIATGKNSLEDLPKLLTGHSAELVQGLAPPQGLALVEVNYPSNII
jgi:tRNA pseudouridine38-40 synthase